MKVSLKKEPVQPAYSESNRMTSSLPVFIFVLVVPLVCMMGAWTSPSIAAPSLSKESMAQVYLGILLTVWFWSQRNIKVTTLSFSRVTLLFFGLFVLGTLSIFWATNVDFFITRWLMWFCVATVFFFGLKVEHNEKNLNTIFNCLVVAGTLVSLIGLAQYLFSFGWLPMNNNQPSSTFGNKNMAGQVIVLLWPFALFFLFSNKTSKIGIWAYSICIAVMLSYVFIILSVGVLLSCFLEILLIATILIVDGSKRKGWFFWNLQKTFAVIFSTLLFFVLCNPATVGINPSYERAELSTKFSTVLSKARSTEGAELAPRYKNFKDAIEMIEEDPILGSGLGSFFEKFNNGGANHQQMVGSRQVHNDTLELGVELGLSGLSILMAIVLAMCSCLVGILKHSEGANRLGAVLLTSAVTGSVLNAQFSFPFSQVTPLVIISLLVAMLTRSAQQHSPAQIIKKFKVSARFQKYSFLVSASILIGIIFLNIQWISDYNAISENFGNQSQLSPYIVKSKVLNPEIIMVLKEAAMVSRHVGAYQGGLNFLSPLIELWPTAPVFAVLAVGLNEKLSNLEETERWANVLVNSQPRDSVLGELFLIEVYGQQGNLEGLKGVYNKLSGLPASFFIAQPLVLDTIIALSVVLGDEAQTPLVYQQYIDLFPTTVKVETVMASYYYKLEQYGRSLPHMRKALDLDPGMADAVRFKKTLEEYSGSPLDEYHSEL